MLEYENLQKVNQKLFSAYESFFQDFLNSGWYVLGKEVSNFERQFAQYCGTKQCVGVASGLDALILAIDACGFDKGAEIIVPSNTYIATILAIVRCGHIPVLVEPDIQTYNIDSTKIENAITRKTKAILVVHLYGKSCDMDPIINIAMKYGLRIIEDAAQAHGATYKGKKVGAFGVGCFSFYPTKNLGALGDAGAISSSDPSFMERVILLRNYGSAIKYHNDLIGYNSRLDEVQAGFLSIKLGFLDEINNHKRTLAKLYLEYLDDKYIKPAVHKDYFDVYHIFNIRCSRRDQLKSFLLENKVQSEIHYPIPPHYQKSMRGILNGRFPISEQIHSTTLSLPISFFHTKDDIMLVIEIMNGWQR